MKWYENNYRRNLVDMHIQDWDDRFLSEFDPQFYYDCLQKAHITNAMIYTQSHTGLCNWESKSGTTHRAFVGNNKIRTLFDLCHAGGIAVVAYYSLIYNVCEYEKHPDWHIIDCKGNPSRSDPAANYKTTQRHGLLCPNNKDYRAFLAAQFRELFAAYDCEGIYLDMTFWPHVCYCDTCRARWKEESGHELPVLTDWHDPDWLAFQKARQRWLGEFAQYCTDTIHAIRPNVTVEHQLSPLARSWQQGVTYLVNNASEFSGGDLYGGFREESYICKLYREATHNQPFEYQTTRCPDLGRHTTTKSLRELRKHNYIAAAHHGAFLVIDAIDPVGTINPAVYDRIGTVFADTIPLEQYYKGDLVAEAALIVRYNAYNSRAEAKTPDKADGGSLQTKCQTNLAQTLTDLNMLYTVLPSDRLERLQGKKLAFLTEAPDLTDAEREQICAFVQNGGNLYASGLTDPRLLEKVLGLLPNGVTQHNTTYLSPTAAGQSVFGAVYSTKYPLSHEGLQPIYKNSQGHTVLATITLPYTKPDTNQFASIHSNPPGIPTEDPAIVLGSYGKGKVLWISAYLERSRQPTDQAVLRNLIALLHKPEIVESNAPSCVEFTLFFDKKNNRYLLNIVNLLEQDDISLNAFDVTLRLGAKFKHVKHLPDAAPVIFETADDHVVIHVPTVDLFEMFEISET